MRTVLRALRHDQVPFCVIGAAALAARGLPRMTRDLDVVVIVDDAPAAWAALEGAGLAAATPKGSEETPEAMVTFVDPRSAVEVDLLVSRGDPEATVIDQASDALLFGTPAKVAELEHLLVLYLYSNQPKHIGDFATIVQSKRADLAKTERFVADVHPEMLSELRERIRSSIELKPPLPRPPPRKR